eukprot:5208181-Prymnesium_polylepis.1
MIMLRAQRLEYYPSHTAQRAIPTEDNQNVPPLDRTNICHARITKKPPTSPPVFPAARPPQGR